MRKQNKIISLILVVALLFSMLIFTVPSAAAEEGSDTFAPSATYVKTADGATVLNAIKSSVAGNKLFSTGMVQFNNADDGGGKVPATSGIVTDTVTGDKYLELLPGDAGSNSYVAAYPVSSSGVVVSKKADNQYWVLDMDVAFYSKPSTNFGWYAVCRDGGGLFGTNVSTSPTFRNAVAALELGVFHHFTSILDFDNNTINVFVNGKFVVSVAAGVYGASGAAKYEGTTMKFEQFRLFPSTVDSFLVGNVAVREATDVSGAASALSTGNLSAWSEDISSAAEHGKIPAFATVDGEAYCNLTDLAAALAGGVLPAKVEILRDIPGSLTVSRDAVVNTNGCAANLVAGENVTLSVNGDVKTFDAPWAPSYSVASASSFASLKDESLANNLVYDNGGLSNWNDAAIKAETMSPVGENDSFSVMTSVAAASTANHFVNLGLASFKIDYTNFYVFDMDVASNTDFINEMTVTFVIRGAAGVSKSYDTASTSIANFVDADGQWHHITLVGDTANNKMYTFVDGVLVRSSEQAYNSGNKVEGENPTVSAIRLNVSPSVKLDVGDMMAFDNVGIRNVAASDTALVSALAAGNLFGWSGAVTSAERDVLPVLATVDGEPAYSASDISSKLIGNEIKNVEFYADVPGEVNVNCDAVINTNGCTVNFVAGKDVTFTQDGNVYTFDAPYVQSVTYSNRVVSDADVAILTAEIKGSVTGNIWQERVQWNVKEDDDGYVYLATNTINGDKYLYHDGSYALASGNAANNNSYIELMSMTTVNYTETEKVYMVYDFDYAQFTDGAVPTMIIPRVSGSGKWGANNVSVSTAAASHTKGEFVHLTYVYDVMSNKAHVYVNGERYTDNSNWTSAENFEEFVSVGSVRFDGIRLGSNSTANFAVDNYSIRQVVEPVGSSAAGSMNAAFASGDIKLWSGAITAPESQTAPVATVDGEYVGSSVALTEALNGRTVKNVEIIADVAGSVTVNCDAVIETNGLKVNLVAGSGVTVTTNGTVKTFDAPWKPSATEVKNPNYTDIINAVKLGDMASYSGSGNYTDDTVIPYLVTDTATGNSWLEIRPGADLTAGTKHNFFSFNVAGSKTVYDSTKALVFSFDYYAPQANNPDLYIGVTTRNAAGSNIGGQTWFLTNYNVPAGEWVRVTAIGDVANNKLHIYLNGVKVATVSKGVYNSSGFETGYYLEGIRFNVNTRLNMTKDMTVAIDNFNIDVNCTDAWVNANLGADTLEGWTDAPSYDLPEIPSIATVDGVEYNNAAEIEEALTDGKNHVISLDRPFGAHITSATTATVITNGIDNFITGGHGLAAVDNGDGTVSIKTETRTGKIVVNINGKTAVDVDLLYGTDLAEYLEMNNAYVFGVIADNDGNVYYNATWDKTPAVVSGDATYNVTGTALGSNILQLSGDDGSVISTNPNLVSQLTNNSAHNYIFVFGTDADIIGNSPNIHGHNKFYLAGHTFKLGIPGNHGAQLTGYSRNVTFIGGNLVDVTSTNTQAMFFAAYEFAYEVKFVNVNITAVAVIATMRGGTATFENSNVNVIEAQGANAIQLCEYYNAGYTYNKCALNIIDSTFRFVHYTEQRATAAISVKSFTEWNNGTPKDQNMQAALNKGADTLRAEVVISGSTFMTGFNTPLFNNTKAESDIFIENTQLNTKILFSTNNGNMVIGSGVVSGAPLTGVTFDDGVKEINSGNPQAPFGYEKNYATVTWSDGTTELWADGTYPANADCKYDKVCLVESGESYVFEAAENFKLKMSANMTLDADLKFNVYVPTTEDLLAINIAGVAFDVASAEVVKVKGVDCWMFQYVVAPYFAAGAFSIVATTSEGTLAREMDLVEYANMVLAAYTDNTDATNLTKAILSYVAAAHKFMGAYVSNYDATENFADAPAVAMPTGGTNTMTNVNAFFTSAQLNLDAAPKWRFNTVAGADLSDLVITVNGVAVDFVVANGYVEVEVPAYNMLKDITISVGGVSGTYSFGAYYANQVAVAPNAAPKNYQAGANVAYANSYKFVNSGILDAFYTYAFYANAYKA